MANASLVLLAASLIAVFLPSGTSSLDMVSVLFEEDEGAESSLAADPGQNWFDIDIAPALLPSAAAFIPERHVDWEEARTDFRLNMGKKWEVKSPSLPGTVDVASGYYLGSIRFRRTHYRAARFVAFSDAVLMTLRGALNQDLIADLPANGGLRGELTDWPQILGRLDLTLGIVPRPVDQPSWAFQVTSTLGFLEASPPPLGMPPADARFETWSVNADLPIAVSESLGCRSVFFTGMYSRLQGPMYSTSGWCEVWYDWTPRWHSRVGVGIDDPDGFLGRIHHHFIFATLSLDLTDHLATGIEVAWRETLWQDSGVGQLLTDRFTQSEPARVVVIDLMLRCSF